MWSILLDTFAASAKHFPWYVIVALCATPFGLLALGGDSQPERKSREHDDHPRLRR